MTERKRPGRKPEVERQAYAAKVRDYLQRHREGDPKARSLSFESIAKGAGVSRTQLADANDPIIASLLFDIQAARGTATNEQTAYTRGPARPSGKVGVESTGKVQANAQVAEAVSGNTTLTDDDVAVRIKHHLREVGRVMQTWMGHHRRLGAAEDAALALHDLDKAIGSLHHQAEALRGFVAEQQRRLSKVYAASAPAGVSAPGTPRLPGL